MTYGNGILLKQDNRTICNMKRIIIICEGQTERDFCQKVLAPYLWQYRITIQTPLNKISGGGIV